MQISRCIFRSLVKTRPRTGDKKTHPTETVEQNVRRAKNNYVIAGEIRRRKRVEKSPRDHERRQDFWNFAETKPMLFQKAQFTVINLLSAVGYQFHISITHSRIFYTLDK